MTPQREASSVGGIPIERTAKAVVQVGVVSVIAGVLLYLLFVTLKSVESKLDGHVIVSEQIKHHLDEEKDTHAATINILKQMCVMQATTAQERRECLK